MNNEKHTPGPWTADLTLRRGVYFRVHGDGIAVADITREYAEEDREMIDANARLIAAAPELLATCVECARVLGEYTGPSMNGMNAAFENALSAIAKATGGES